VTDSETTSSFKTIISSNGTKRNVGNEILFVSLRAQGKGIKLRVTFSSCSKSIGVLPLVPDNLKDRKAVFGYLFDDAAQRNYYDNMGVEDVEDYLDIDQKYSIVRDADGMAQCGAGILALRTTTHGKRAVLACFGSYDPPYYFNGLPIVDALTEFKELLFLDKDPEWFAI